MCLLGWGGDEGGFHKAIKYLIVFDQKALINRSASAALTADPVMHTQFIPFYDVNDSFSQLSQINSLIDSKGTP